MSNAAKTKVKQWVRSLPVRIVLAVIVFAVAALFLRPAPPDPAEPAKGQQSGLMDLNTKETVEAAEAAEALKALNKPKQ